MASVKPEDEAILLTVVEEEVEADDEEGILYGVQADVECPVAAKGTISRALVCEGAG